MLRILTLIAALACGTAFAQQQQPYVQGPYIAPTAPLGDTSNRIANMAAVQAALNAAGVNNPTTQTTSTCPITVANTDGFIFVSPTGACTVNLPAAVSKIGNVTIADVSGNAGQNAITVVASGSEKINGQSNYLLHSAYGTITLTPRAGIGYSVPSQGTPLGVGGIYRASDWGFKCDSSTDDTPAWNAFMALSWAGKIPPYSTLFFDIGYPDGHYCRFASKPNQWGNSLKIAGSPWFLRDYQPGQVLKVTNATNNGSGLIRITVDSTAGMTTGEVVGINNVIGTNEANGLWQITVINGTQFDLATDIFGQPSVFTHAFGALTVTGVANSPAGTCVTNYTQCIRLTTSVGAGSIAYSPVNVDGILGVSAANGQFRAVVVDNTHIDLGGAVFSGSYTSGGVVWPGSVFTAPLQPFIEVGPQSNTDHSNSEVAADHLLVYAGDGTYGGVGLSMGSFNINGTGYGDVTYSRFNNIAISGSFSGRFGVNFKVDGSQSPGIPEGAFSGNRLNHLTGYFAQSGYWMGIWLRSVSAWVGTDIYNTGSTTCVAAVTYTCSSPGTAINGDLYIDGVDAILEGYSVSVNGGSTPNIIFGQFSDSVDINMSNINNVIYVNTGTKAIATNVTSGFCNTTPTMHGTNNRVTCNGNVYLSSASTLNGPGFTINGATNISGGTSANGISGVSCGSVSAATMTVENGIVTHC